MTAGLLEQPKAVWAVAFACVVAFMGIGLVDPILLRFGGGAVAPWLAGRLAEAIAPGTPYLVGAGAVALAFALLLALRESIGAADAAAPPARPAAIRHSLTRSLSDRDDVEVIVVEPEEAAA